LPPQREQRGVQAKPAEFGVSEGKAASVCPKTINFLYFCCIATKMSCKSAFRPYNSFMLHCNIANKGQVSAQIVFLNLVFY
jgi:hypothetical protein